MIKLETTGEGITIHSRWRSKLKVQCQCHLQVASSDWYLLKHSLHQVCVMSLLTVLLNSPHDWRILRESLSHRNHLGLELRFEFLKTVDEDLIFGLKQWCFWDSLVKRGREGMEAVQLKASVNENANAAVGWLGDETARLLRKTRSIDSIYTSKLQKKLYWTNWCFAHCEYRIADETFVSRSWSC